jgi:hypothetical protein
MRHWLSLKRRFDRHAVAPRRSGGQLEQRGMQRVGRRQAAEIHRETEITMLVRGVSHLSPGP